MFKKYLNFVQILENNKIIYLPENFSWIKDFSLPNLSLDIPEIEKSAKIRMIMNKINPIYIGLSDGSKLFFTIDEFNRISGTPVVGKTLVWRMQRLSGDNSQRASKITMCKVL